MIKQITTYIANKPGSLASLCRLLKEHDIDMRAMNVSDAMGFGIVRLIVNEPDNAKAVLESGGFICHFHDVLAIEVPDRPGSLVELLEAFGAAGVNLDYTYALFSRHEGTSAFVIETTDTEEATAALEKSGVRILVDGEL